MGDPLFAHGVDLAVVLIVILKAVVTFAVVLVSVLFMVVFERKSISWMQNRVGPNRAGPRGYLQSLADGTKLFFKEALLPEQGRPPDLPAGPVPGRGAGVHDVLDRADRRHGHHRPPHHPAPAGRPAVGDPVPAHDVVDLASTA